MAELHKGPDKSDCCSNCTSRGMYMLCHCRSEGPRLCWKQDTGWAGCCTNDCLGGKTTESMHAWSMFDLGRALC